MNGMAGPTQTAPPLSDDPGDGVRGMVPRAQMAAPALKLRDAYAIVPDAPLYQREFGYYCLERWKEQGMPQDVPLEQLFHYDPPGNWGYEKTGSNGGTR